MRSSFLSVPQNTVWESEQAEKKSRFLGFATQVDNVSEAEKFLSELRAKHKDARHIAFAWRFQNLSKASDDGEPHGTAGKPILQIVERLDLCNIVVAVVRYFGGVKLGSGPLLRAYSACASAALKFKPALWTLCSKVRLEVSFPEFEKLIKMAERKELSLSEIEFSQSVTLTAILPKTTKLQFGTMLQSEDIFFHLD